MLGVLGLWAEGVAGRLEPSWPRSEEPLDDGQGREEERDDADDTCDAESDRIPVVLAVVVPDLAEDVGHGLEEALGRVEEALSATSRSHDRADKGDLAGSWSGNSVGGSRGLLAKMED